MINVAIDGPAGAGKSTIAKAAAKKLGFIYVDTGALYRTIALNAVRNNALEDTDKLIEMLETTDVKLAFDPDEQGTDMTAEMTAGQFLSQDDKKIIGKYLKPSGVRYRWTGSKFNLEK